MTTHAENAAPAVTRAANPLEGARSTIVAAALGLASATVAGVLLVRPWPERDAFEYDQIAPSRDGIWTGVLIDGIAFAVVALSLSLVVAALARTRGAAWANVGAVVTTLGGIVFAMGAYAFGSLGWYATDTTVLDEQAGAQLLDRVVDEVAHGMVLQMAGFLACTVGTILLSVALLRSRTVSRWVPIAILALTLAQFTPVPGRALDFVQIALMGVFVLLAVMFVRVARSGR